ncbi:MAG: hypothetical protein AAF802_20755 [Planctomycetota bacterium]
MKDQLEFTLELPDGTRFRVGSRQNKKQPDVKAFLLPAGALVPFTENNPPRERAAINRTETLSLSF